MKISAKTEYGLRTVVDLAMHGDMGAIRVADISKRQGIPGQFLEQILLSLKTGDLVKSKRGIKGGYQLAKPSSEISLADVVRIIQPSLIDTRTVENREENIVSTVANELWTNIDEIVSRQLYSVTISDMAQEVIRRKNDQTVSYQI